MKLILVRHGKAQRPNTGGNIPEPMIPLTAEGIEGVRALAARIAEKEPSAALRILCSPKQRALETAAIIARYFPVAAVEELEYLSEDCFSYDELVGFLIRECGAGETVVVVSHAPVLADLAFAFVPRTELPSISFATASAACVAFDAAPAQAAGRLLYRIAPEA